MPVVCVVVEVDGGRVPDPVDRPTDEVTLVLAVRGEPLDPTDLPPGVVQLPIGLMGADLDERRTLAAAAAMAMCHLRDLLVVAPEGSALLGAAAAVGARGALGDGASVTTAIAAAEREEAARAEAVGVGPHAQPWPDDDRLDPALLRDGDRRNVVDRYRYWREAAIVEDLAAHRHPFHVAVENWQHDLNIGTVVRNANAFGAAGVHIVGERRWNRRGAMATDRYLPVHHHASVEAFVAWAADAGLVVVGVDNLPGAVDLDGVDLPRSCVLVFGQEGPGLSSATVARCAVLVEITQFGSTRSLNAGVASGIAMHRWVQCHAWNGTGPPP